MNGSGRTVVLVHGSWLGAWVWGPVCAELERLGARPYAASLSGLGDRAGESRPDIGLERHVEDVVALLDSLDAGPITIVGHSYGSVVAAEAAALRPGRIEALVVVDGLLAEAGRSLFDLIPELKPILVGQIDPGAPDFMQPLPPEFLGLTDADLEGVANALTPMPLLTHVQAAHFTATDLACPRAYIGFSGFAFGEALSARATGLGWRATCVPGGHMAILEQPATVAEFVLA